MDVFKQRGVIPEVLDEVPSHQLQVKFGDEDVRPGMILTPTQVQQAPKVTWQASSEDHYALLFHDPDAPSTTDHKFGEWHHWLVVNIPGCDITKGQVMSEYVGSAPGKGSGLHRYVLLVYKQSGRVDFPGLVHLTAHSAQGRRCWKAREFAAHNNLGQPVAGNMFLAEYDESVPAAHKRLGLA